MIEIKNFECGVVLPRPHCFMHPEHDYVPWQRPARSYSASDEPFIVSDLPPERLDQSAFAQSAFTPAQRTNQFMQQQLKAFFDRAP